MSPTGCWFNAAAAAAAALVDVERTPTTAAAATTECPSHGAATVHRMQVRSTDTLPGGRTARWKRALWFIAEGREEGKKPPVRL